MGWMGTGYESTDDPYKNVPDRGNRGPSRVWMPAGTTKRFLFLDDDPTTFWEHNFKWNGTYKGNHEPCVHKNKLAGWEQGCPICVAYNDKYPYFVGLHTVISLSPWYTKKTQEIVNLTRQIFAAKLGSEDKPGVLRKLKKLSEKHGRLRGLVFDIERPGKKTESCGSEFELVEAIPLDEIDSYLRKQVEEYIAEKNQKRSQDKQLTVDELMAKMVPFDFEEVVKPRPIAELREMFKPGQSSSSSDGDTGRDDDEDEDGAEDGDVPY